MNSYELKGRREVCWDTFLMESSRKVEVKMHHPVKREKVLTLNHFWEGTVCGYGALVKVEGGYRLYYRAGDMVSYPDKTYRSGVSSLCLAESSDGLHYKRVPVNKHDYHGIKTNNIVYYTGEYFDNFMVYYDENPDCLPQEQYKGLAMLGTNHELGHGLALFVSPDGIDFTLKRKLDLPGEFDSYNVILWDREAKLYRLYYRSERRQDLEQFDVVVKSRKLFREVHMATSEDLEHFTVYGQLDYGPDAPQIQLYTNQISKYYRADHMYIGFPARYIDRWEDEENFKQMPLAERHQFITECFGREGTVVTDCAIMTSRDGYHFDRWEEAYLTPGIESRNNWWYGDCFTVYGLAETEAEEEGAPNEISFLMGESYHIKDVELYRYTTRLDGFFSWYAGYKGGEILTKPFLYEGNQLEINFASSALGGLRIWLCDEEGNAIEGFDSGVIFGDSVDRKVRFRRDLREYEGKSVRMKIFLQDCDLYSFRFFKV